MRKWSDVRESIKSISREEKEEIAAAAKLTAQLVMRREQLGMTQRQLAEKTGIKQAAIARIEMNGAIPRIDTLYRLSKGLDLKIKLVPSK